LHWACRHAFFEPAARWFGLGGLPAVRGFFSNGPGDCTDVTGGRGWPAPPRSPPWPQPEGFGGGVGGIAGGGPIRPLRRWDRSLFPPDFGARGNWGRGQLGDGAFKISVFPNAERPPFYQPTKGAPAWVFGGGGPGGNLALESGGRWGPRLGAVLRYIFGGKHGQAGPPRLAPRSRPSGTGINPGEGGCSGGPIPGGIFDLSLQSGFRPPGGFGGGNKNPTRVSFSSPGRLFYCRGVNLRAPGGGRWVEPAPCPGARGKHGTRPWEVGEIERLSVPGNRNSSRPRQFGAGLRVLRWLRAFPFFIG